MKKLIPLALLLSASLFSPANAATAALFAPFKVEITLTDKAAEKLKSSGDMLEIDAYYLGTPRAGDTTPVNDNGDIELGQDSKTISGPATVTIGNSEYDGSLLEHLIDREAHLLINVNSSTQEENILECDIFENKLSVAVKDLVKLNCKLIGE
jgi:hypothetical protein